MENPTGERVNPQSHSSSQDDTPKADPFADIGKKVESMFLSQRNSGPREDTPNPQAKEDSKEDAQEDAEEDAIDEDEQKVVDEIESLCMNCHDHVCIPQSDGAASCESR